MRGNKEQDAPVTVESIVKTTIGWANTHKPTIDVASLVLELFKKRGINPDDQTITKTQGVEVFRSGIKLMRIRGLVMEAESSREQHLIEKRDATIDLRANVKAFLDNPDEEQLRDVMGNALLVLTVSNRIKTCDAVIGNLRSSLMEKGDSDKEAQGETIDP